MTYSFVETTGLSKSSKGLTPELQSIYKRIPETVSHVPHESFELPATEQELFGSENDEVSIPKWTHFPEVPEDTPTSRKARKALSKDEEARLFLRFNYARYRLGKLTAKQLKRFSRRRSEEMIRWYQHARAVQASIVDANMALVMAMARRTRIPHVDFPELVSEGNMALLRAIEKFDVSRGFKFSTYACRAILKGFNRMATKTGRYVQRFPTEFDPDLERSDYDVLKHRIQQDNAIDDLKEVLATNRAKLTDVEQTVVTERFALESGGKKKTLNEVGQQVGLTTERVRQIQKKALAKLKATLNEEYLAA
ncbi:MAG: sigma-70 family RNA polymerase sigma factor [Phycisphaerae bacterium]|jgi:RNA polymerase sigma factor (sigma-70 family)|nr:sigma-70 family RNA polymerase sigma factor [Phycisphaerae bacterium]